MFQLCIDSLEATNSKLKDDFDVVSLPRIFLLVTELYNSGLVSVAYVYAFLRRLVTHSRPGLSGYA